MSYETRAYDDDQDGPVVVIVVKGVHDVSRVVHLFSRGLCEHVSLSETMLRQVKRHNGGRAALALLKAHGGPDFTAPEPDLAATTWTDEHGHVWDLSIGYRSENGDAWAPIGWLAGFDAVPVPYLECRGLAADIETVIRDYGPLTPDPADGAS